MKMITMERDEILHKIRSAKSELRTAGPIHRRDLQKHIKRLQAQLMAIEKAKEVRKA